MAANIRAMQKTAPARWHIQLGSTFTVSWKGVINVWGYFGFSITVFQGFWWHCGWQCLVNFCTLGCFKSNCHQVVVVVWKPKKACLLFGSHNLQRSLTENCYSKNHFLPNRFALHSIDSKSNCGGWWSPQLKVSCCWIPNWGNSLGTKWTWTSRWHQTKSTAGWHAFDKPSTEVGWFWDLHLLGT